MNKLTNLPAKWSRVKLGDVTEDMMIGIVKSTKEQFNEKKGVAYIKMNNVTLEGNIDVNNVVNVEVAKDELEKFSLKKGDILFNTRNSYELVGKTGIIKDDKSNRVYNNNLLRIRVKKEFDPDFINYQMNSYDFREKLKQGKRATTNICAIYQKDLFPISLMIPPLPDQQKIVAKIEELFSELDSGIASLKKAKGQIKTYRQAVLASAFSGKLTRDYLNPIQVSYPISKAAEPEISYGKELPEGWKWVKLGEIIKVSSGKGLTSDKMVTKGNYPVYGGNGITGYYDNYLFKESKLIIGRVGAKCGVVHITESKSWVTDNALVVEFISNNINIKFLYHCLGYHNLNKLSVSTAQPVISGAKIYPYLILLPPINQQFDIVEEIEKRLSEADNLEKAIDESLAKAETLRQSILKQAFEGRLV